MAAPVVLTPRQQSVSLIVKQLLAHHDMSRRTLARLMGLHPTTVGQTLNGLRKWSIEDLETMAQIFDVPVSRFFEDPQVLFPGLAAAESPSRESNPGPSHYE